MRVARVRRSSKTFHGVRARRQAKRNGTRPAPGGNGQSGVAQASPELLVTDAADPDPEASEAEVATEVEGAADATGLEMALSGGLRPAPQRGLARLLIYGTGLFLLAPLLQLLQRLLGWQWRGRLQWQGDELTLHSELGFLGYVLRDELEQLPSRRLVSAAAVSTTPPQPAVLGALALTISLVWGLLLVADGVYGRSGALVAWGLVAIAAGLVVDLLILGATRLWPDPQRHGLLLRLDDGRAVHLMGVAPAEAAQWAEQLGALARKP